MRNTHSKGISSQMFNRYVMKNSMRNSGRGKIDCSNKVYVLVSLLKYLKENKLF